MLLLWVMCLQATCLQAVWAVRDWTMSTTGFEPALAYRARKNNSEVLILGTKHDEVLAKLQWGPKFLNVLKRFKPSSAFFENNDMEQTFKMAKMFMDLSNSAGAMAKLKYDGSGTALSSRPQDKAAFDKLEVAFQKELADPTLQAWLNLKYEKSNHGNPLPPGTGFTTAEHAVYNLAYDLKLKTTSGTMDKALYLKMKDANVPVEFLEDFVTSSRSVDVMNAVEYDKRCSGTYNSMNEVWPVLTPLYQVGQVAEDAIRYAVCESMIPMDMEETNARWAAKIIQRSPQRGYFNVGLAHLYDPFPGYADKKVSILHHFANAGYMVEKEDVNDPPSLRSM